MLSNEREGLNGQTPHKIIGWIYLFIALIFPHYNSHVLASADFSSGFEWKRINIQQSWKLILKFPFNWTSLNLFFTSFQVTKRRDFDYIMTAAESKLPIKFEFREEYWQFCKFLSDTGPSKWFLLIAHQVCKIEQNDKKLWTLYVEEVAQVEKII